MRFMNDHDIESAIRRFTVATKPNRLGVALMLKHLAEWTDANSDGWPYWSKPARAADKAMALVESRTWAENKAQEETDATDAEVKAAMTPVKAFLTRQGVSPEVREIILRGTQPIRD